ncbi:iron-sulfur assembly ATPase [Besnoitia besnoiti]|uniref:Iron-sulfur assembly ATPase n=1 Tax=Besnoitia besnoiti TaxID=94643 RepID=A0A2A9MIG3_BESBE|nr:iron-sulfur assembly ATPase [Besnoitia besnoiti]PFH35190.1 iron-sulfur assembly ATPase [Besnoitia besnoiti]
MTRPSSKAAFVASPPFPSASPPPAAFPSSALAPHTAIRPHHALAASSQGSGLCASASSPSSPLFAPSQVPGGLAAVIADSAQACRDAAPTSPAPSPAFLSAVHPAAFDRRPQKMRWRDLQQLRDSREERFAALKSMREQETPCFQADHWAPDQPLLEIEDLRVEAEEDGQQILKGVNLTVMPGEIHAIMGRNGSGKSTLSKVLAGYPSYKVTGGRVRYKGMDLLELPIDNRGLAGLFLAFQYPIEIPLVSNLEFLRVAYNERLKWKGQPEVDSYEFREHVEQRLQEVGLDRSFLDRPLNYGFSGGEKKRNEILQMLLLDPELVMLDETDSGLDVDSFNITAAAIKRFSQRKGKSFLVTTHYKKLLDVIQPHKIHVMHAGKIVLSGSLDLAGRIEAEGFKGLVGDAAEGEEPDVRDTTQQAESEESENPERSALSPSALSPSAAGGGRRDLDRLL